MPLKVYLTLSLRYYRTHIRQYFFRQRVRLMILQYFAGFCHSPLVAVGCTRCLPCFHAAAIDEFRPRVRSHVLEGVILGQEILPGSHRFDDINGQGFIINGKTSDGLFDHPGKFIIQHQLGKIESDAALKHSQTINQIGPCQCCDESGEGFLMAQLRVGYFGITLPAGDVTGQGIIARQSCHCSANDGTLGSAYGGGGDF